MSRKIVSGNSAVITRVACAIAILIFTFCYLYFYQADIIYVKLYALSGGKVCYDRTIGAILITLIMFPLVLLCILKIAKSLKSLWANLLILTIIFFIIGLASCGNDVMHYRARMEILFMKGRFDDALKVGKKSLATDRSLTMLRIYALAHEKKLGERLFEYPMEGSSTVMYPNKTTECLVYPKKDIINFIDNDGAADYLLCGLLLDRNLDAFAKEISKYYDVNAKSLPKHYKEALILYTHTRSNPQITYYDEVMDVDYEDMKALENKYDDSVRNSYIKDVYGNTYWYYFFYGANDKK